MGSQAIQARLWGRQPADWSKIQESTGQPGYDHALRLLALTGNEVLLDIGCGSGLFCSQAAGKVLSVTGLDATPELIEEARRRAPELPFQIGDMETLPFPDDSFDIVTGFNSFQYAADISAAFAEARRVLKPGGRLLVMIWGNKEDCEAASYLKALGSLLPPPPPGAPGPFALTENQLLEKTLEAAGFSPLNNTDIPSVWDYPDQAIALRGLLSAGPATRAIDHSGPEKVEATMLDAMKPYIRDNGHVVYRNKFRVVLAGLPIL